MDVTRVSAIAEIVSSVAILATLGYLALEMRQNTIAIQGATRQAMLGEDRELLALQIEYPFVYPYVQDVSELTDAQKVQLSSWLIAFSRVREGIWLQYQAGVIDERTLSAYLAPFLAVMSLEHTREWWRLRTARGVFDPGFVEHVDGLLSERPIQPLVSLKEDTGFE
jgi:hypothetical protein